MRKKAFLPVWILCVQCSLQASDYRLTISNQTSTNVLVGGCWFGPMTTSTIVLPDVLHPLAADFGGTNYFFDFLTDRTIVFGENLLETRTPASPLGYFMYGFVSSGVLALSGWAMAFMRKFTSTSAEL